MTGRSIRSTRVLFQIMRHRRSFGGDLAWLTPPQGAAPRPNPREILNQIKTDFSPLYVFEHSHSYTFLCEFNFFCHYLHQRNEIKSTPWSYSGNCCVICVAIRPWIFANQFVLLAAVILSIPEANASLSTPQSIVDGDAHHVTAYIRCSCSPRHAQLLFDWSQWWHSITLKWPTR